LLWFLILVAALVGFFTMSWWMPRRWYRALLYPGGRPNALARMLNLASAWASSIGIAPTLMISLETKGRRTGRTLRVPLVVAELEGDRYLVSMLGQNPDWVRNVRASNGEALLRHGIVEQVRLQEVAVSERPPILRAYLKRAPGARPHFDISVDAPIEEFARIAPPLRSGGSGSVLPRRYGKGGGSRILRPTYFASIARNTSCSNAMCVASE
jgi:hypothetical protein